jgi:alpha-galactosidase
MTSDMLEAQRAWLPQYAGRMVNPVPTISVAKNVARQPVPTDPALAIANRFGKLAEVKG